jgi:hypothetical protein
MLTKLTVAAVLVLAVASAAQAGSKDDADAGGGYRVGPVGWMFDRGVNPAHHRSLRGNAAGAFAYGVAPATLHK